MIYNPTLEQMSTSEMLARIGHPTAQFLAAHNLSAHKSLTRMDIAELRIWYDAVAYSPQVNGIEYRQDILLDPLFDEDLSEFIA